MNERIQELAEQAKAESSQWLGSKPAITITHDELEKFSELIVQETLMQMAIQMNKFGDDQSNNPAWYKSEEAVKKHFGVEDGN